MPATNILDALNDAVTALNSLVTATNSQVLSVTNNFAPTNDFAPVNNFAPTNNTTVNFDTQAIVDELALMVTGQTTMNGHMGNMVTGQTTMNGHLSNIADRLAPDGKSIQPTLELLIAALDAKISVPVATEAYPTTDTTYNAPDPIKCLAAKRAIGHNVKMYYYWKQNWTIAKVLAITEVGMVAILSGGAIMTSISGVVTSGALDLIFSWSQATIDTFYNEFLAIAPDMVEAVYSSTDAQQAITAIEAVISGATWTDAYSEGLATMLIPITPISKVYADPKTLTPSYYGGQELGDWTSLDCSGFTLPISNDIVAHNNYPTVPVDNTAILNAGVWVYGTHNNIHSWLTGAPVESVSMSFVTPTVVTIEAVGDGQTIQDFSVMANYTDAVNGTYTQERDFLTNAQLPYTTGPIYGFRLINTSPLNAFTATITIYDPGV